MFKLIIKSLRKNILTYIYIFFQMLLVSVAIILASSIYKDVYDKISRNETIMNLSTYSVLETNLYNDEKYLEKIDKLEADIKEKDMNIPYYKNIGRSTIMKSGREIESVFLVSKDFLEIKNFDVSEGEDLKSTKEKNAILIGSNITEFDVGDEVELNSRGEIITGKIDLKEDYQVPFDIEIDDEVIKAKIVGRLSDENIFWIREFTVPLNISKNIVMLDNEKIEPMVAKNYFITADDKNFNEFKSTVEEIFSEESDKVFLTMKDQLKQILISKDSPAYIIAVFIVILTVIAINCIAINVSINFYKRLKEFGIRMALGFTNNDLFKMIVGEFYIISIAAYIASYYIGKNLQKVIPKQLGYTFDNSVAIISFILFIIYTLPILYSVYSKMKKLTPNKLIKENL